MDDILNNQLDESQEVVQQEQVESQKDKNLRMMRDNYNRMQEKLEAIERERERERQMFDRYSQQSQNNVRRDDDDIEDDGYIDGRRYKQMKKNLEEQERRNREIEERVMRMQQQTIEQNAEAKLRSQHSDFFSVVNSENMKTLAAVSPDDYEAIKNTADIYARGKLAYMALKHSGIAKGSANIAASDQRLEENRNRPKAAASAPAKAVNNSALANIENYEGRRVLTKEDKIRTMERLAILKRQNGR